MTGVAEGDRCFDAVVFDLWGTLIPFPPEYYRYLAGELAEALGLAVDDFAPAWAATFTARACGARTEEALARACLAVGHSPSLEQINAASDRRLASFRAILRPRADAAAVVTELRRSGLKIGLLSDCGCEVVELWPQFALAPLIDVAVFSFQEGMTKPAAPLYRKVLMRLGVDAAGALYVGDRADELEGAAAVGLTAVLLDAGEREEQQWQGSRLHSLTELLALLDSGDLVGVRDG
jgi:putative hydrolase of the HAD superfamily